MRRIKTFYITFLTCFLIGCASGELPSSGKLEDAGSVKPPAQVIDFCKRNKEFAACQK